MLYANIYIKYINTQIYIYTSSYIYAYKYISIFRYKYIAIYINIFRIFLICLIPFGME